MKALERDPAIQALEKPPKVKIPPPTEKQRRIWGMVEKVRADHPELIEWMLEMTEHGRAAQRLAIPSGLTGAEALIYRAGARAVALWLKYEGSKPDG